MFYLVEVNRIGHLNVNIEYGDTVALIKSHNVALEFAQKYSETEEPGRVVRVSGDRGECFFVNGHPCTWSGRVLDETNR